MSAAARSQPLKDAALEQLSFVKADRNSEGARRTERRAKGRVDVGRQVGTGRCVKANRPTTQLV